MYTRIDSFHFDLVSLYSVFHVEHHNGCLILLKFNCNILKMEIC